MIPVWIIHLDGCDTVLSGLPEQMEEYWYVTDMKAKPVTNDDSCKTFVQELINCGRGCYDAFQKKGRSIEQICIIGAIPGQASRTAFHLLPSLLIEAMPAIQSSNVHRGVEITGLLFIPHNLIHASYEVRQESALFIEEMHTLIANDENDTFNRVVVYQDIQRESNPNRSYGALNEQQQVEFLFQLLLHLYYCSENEKKIFDFHELNGTGFYSLGVASVYYDRREHLEQKSYELLNKLLELIKDPSNVDENDTEEMITKDFPATTFSAKSLLERLKEDCYGLNVDLKTLESLPTPHPVQGFYKAKLYFSYFCDYLKFMPARALEFTRLFAHTLTKRVLKQFENNKQKQFQLFESVLSGVGMNFAKHKVRYPTFPKLQSAIEYLKNYLKEQTEHLKTTNKQTIFEVPVPDYLSVYYDEYKTNDTKTSEKEIAEKMKNQLKGEPTVMAVLNRCFLAGTVMVFVLIPFLRLISPFIINFGDIDEYIYFWIFLIFLLPFLCQFVRLLRHFKEIRNYKRRLLALALVKVHHKASDMLYKQTVDIYSMMMKACDTYLEQLEQLVQKLQTREPETNSSELPRTLFNQPLVGGSFNGLKLLVKPEVMNEEIIINGSPKKIKEIKNDDYFSIFKDMLHTQDTYLFQFISSSDDNINEDVKSCLEKMRLQMSNKLKINEAQGVVKMINEMLQKNDSAVDLKPLWGMADINGVISDSTKGAILRCRHELEKTPKENYPIKQCNGGNESESYIFLTTWSRPYTNRLNTPSICRSDMKLSDPLQFTVLLTCLYALYKRGNPIYEIGGVKITVASERLRQLEQTIKQTIDKMMKK